MIQFEYRFTERESRQAMRLNGVSRGQSWKILLLVTGCLLPSLVLFYCIEAGLSLVWFAALVVVMMGYTATSYLKSSKQVLDYPQKATLSDSDLAHEFSHSTSQVKWRLFDSIEERSNGFLFGRLSRYLYLPSRVVADRAEELRSLIREVKETSERNLSLSPVELYETHLRPGAALTKFEFLYQQDDIRIAINSNFRRLDGLPEKTTTAKPTSKLGCGLIVASSVTVLLLLLATFEWRDGDPLHYFLVAVGWLLPAAWVIGLVKLIRWTETQRDTKVPKEKVELALLTHGWAIGNPEAVTFYDWRDVSQFYESKNFYGIRTNNELINLIPKRIFSDEESRQRFIIEAMDLKRRAIGSANANVAEVMETGNPYQPPMQ